jgi:hypothetical protein
LRLERVNNKFTCAVDFWLDNITVGFITEFAVDTMKSYTVAEKDFLKGPEGGTLGLFTRRSRSYYMIKV